MPDEINIQKNVSLANYSYLKVGGLAKQFISVSGFEQLQSALNLAYKNNWPVFIFGQASNLIFPDTEFNGLVIKLDGGEPKIIASDKDKEERMIIEVFAGFPMTALARFAANNNLAGLEWAYGLPGTVGGAVRGNAGCYGGETKDVVTEVYILNLENPEERLVYTNKLCMFAYRESTFKNDRKIIVGKVRMQLKPGHGDEIKAKQNEIIAKRNAKFPHKPNTGSFFKNIETELLNQTQKKALENLIKQEVSKTVPTGLMLDRLGLKGLKSGRAQVSDEHANILVNIEKKAKAQDFVDLMHKIQAIVQDRLGINLEPEVHIVEWPN